MATAPARNPSFFRVLIGEFQSKLRIPPLFVKYVFKGKVPSVFTLNSSDSESSWRVRVQTEERDHFFIGGGWSKFVEDHKLEIGDFLVFFLVGCLTFDVITYNRSTCSKNITLAAEKRDAGPQEQGVSTTRKTREEVRFISEVTVRHCSFEKVMKKHMEYQMVLPKKFARETGWDKESITKIKDPRGNIWLINNILVGEQVRLGHGWSKFVHQNEIVVGDTLLFEHIQSEGNLLQFQVVNKQATTCEENTILAGKRGRYQPRRQVQEPPSRKCAPSTSKRTQEFISEEASFNLVLKEYQKYNVLVPTDFAKTMGLVKEPITVIKDSNGRKWQLNILVDGRSYVRFGSGWSEFVEDNKLEVGDMISLWHVPNTGNVISFKIISKAGDGAHVKRNKQTISTKH